MPNDFWDEIGTNFAPLKFGNGKVISSYILLGMQLLIHPGIEVYPC